MEVKADVWLSNEDSDDYWAEGIKASVEIETTDADEVRVGVKLGGESFDAATLYLSRKEADRLSRYLSAASVADVTLPV